jgi:hypothetical protein
MIKFKLNLRKLKSNVNMQLKSFDRNIGYVRLKRADGLHERRYSPRNTEYLRF